MGSGKEDIPQGRPKAEALGYLKSKGNDNDNGKEKKIVAG